MKNETNLACSFMSDPVRDFYIALHSNLNRIFRYDTKRIAEKGIERAEYELNHLMTYLMLRILSFSNGYVLSPQGWMNRCAACDEMARVYFRQADCSLTEKKRQPSQNFETTMIRGIRRKLMDEIAKISSTWACGTDEASYTDYLSLLEYVEPAFRKVLDSGKSLKAYLKELQEEIESWDGPSEPSDMDMKDVHRCRWIATVVWDMSDEDPYIAWMRSKGYSEEFIFDHICGEDDEEEEEGEEVEGEAEAEQKTLKVASEKEQTIRRASESAALPAEPADAVEACSGESSLATPSEKKLCVFGMEWHGTKSDLIDFVAWASNKGLIEEFPTEIARNLIRHGGFGSSSQETLRNKISVRKAELGEEGNSKFPKHSYAKHVKHHGRASDEDAGADE